MIASLSLDLDNKWSYMKTHGDPGWEALPSYLDVVVPRVLDLLDRHGLRITAFVVGQDAALERNAEAIGRLGAAGHEIGNHSFHHEPWFHRFDRSRVEAELSRAEAHIERVTGQRPTGYRAPGYSLTADTLEALAARGYRYDASTLPTFLGPLARAYYFMTARLSSSQRQDRGGLFGDVRDGLRPIDPYRWELRSGDLIEIPVTTMPGLRVPFHPSYVQYLATRSRAAARRYFAAGLSLCRTLGTEPSVLMHPLDFLGADDVPELRFFPAMDEPSGRKLELMDELLCELTSRFEVVTVSEHAETLAARPLKRRQARFARTK